MKTKKILAVPALITALLICILALSAEVSAVSTPKKKSISLDKSSIELYESETFTLTPSVTGFKKCTIQWSSSDKTVASVKKGGVVTALKEGSADITVKIKGTDLKAVCHVSVVQKDPDPNDHQTVTIDGKTYFLSFEDSFDGDSLDETKWERGPEWKRQDLNNYWDDSMSYLDGEGNLIIETSYDEENDRFLSGAVRTKGKFEQAYGYFEIRCTVNTVPGYWTAFWLMGESVADETDGGRNGTEIDIMETPFFREKKVQNTLNWDGYGYRHKSSGNVSKADVYDGEYHTFALLWTESEYVFYIDGEESWRTEAAEAKGTCQVPLYVKISAETGSWTGAPDPADLPNFMKIDYVRVYK
ncbi:MAG: family 16 glycosylhydrolase [Oscillospiraceae bacterium]|nr:family 16 glycosylhydrolase [Oscillospiraceae bacterium]